MIKILCLSRAPLDFRAGIPTYCASFYYGINCDLTFSSPVIFPCNINQDRSVFTPHYREFVFKSRFHIGTFSFSFSYLFFLFTNLGKYDVVHYQHPDPLTGLVLVFYYIFSFLKPKLIISWHADIYQSYRLLALPLLFLDTLLFCFASRIIYLTPFHISTSFFGSKNFFDDKSTVIPCIPEINHPLESYSLDRSANNFLLVSVGRLVNYKGYETAIKAVSVLHPSIHYIIIGDGPLYSSLSSLIDELNLSQRIHLAGEIDDTTKYKILSEANLFLFPSIHQSEAYGIVQIEAMHFSLPIINTKLDNGVNYLMPSDYCITVSPGSVVELSRAIQTFFISDTMLLKYSNLSRLRYSELRSNNLSTSISKMLQNVVQL